MRITQEKSGTRAQTVQFVTQSGSWLLVTASQRQCCFTVVRDAQASWKATLGSEKGFFDRGKKSFTAGASGNLNRIAPGDFLSPGRIAIPPALRSLDVKPAPSIEPTSACRCGRDFDPYWGRLPCWGRESPV
jgi:hypothetical protein